MGMTPLSPGASVARDLIDAVLDAAVTAGVLSRLVADAARTRTMAGARDVQGSGTRLPVGALMSVWEMVVASAGGDHGVGALLALHADLRAFGLLGEALHHARTPFDAYAHIARYARLAHQGVTIAVEPLGAETCVRYRLAGAQDGRHARARWAGLLWATANLALVPARVFDTPLKPRRAWLACPAPATGAAIDAIFGADIGFDAPETQLVFASSDLASTARSGNAALLHYLVALADNELEALPAADDVSAVVAVEIRRTLAGGTAPSLHSVARALCLSRRTLQRRIAGENTTFDRILDEVRRTRAEQLLVEGRRTMSEIAYLLGYGEQAAFSRAARRWFGVAPTKFAASAGTAPRPA